MATRGPLCRNKLAGTCSAENHGCSFRHDFELCELCVVICSPPEWSTHIEGRSHRAKLLGFLSPDEAIPSNGWCTICARQIDTQNNWTAHIEGASHKRKAGISVRETDGGAEDVVPGHLWCTPCKLHFVRKSNHEQTAGHKKRLIRAGFNAAVDEAQLDKHGVVLRMYDDFGVLEPAAATQGMSHQAIVEAVDISTRVAVLGMSLHSETRPHRGSTSPFQIITEKTTGMPSDRQGKVTKSQPFQFNVLFQSKDIGPFTDTLEVSFLDISQQKRFVITRPLRAIAGEKEEYENVKPKTPFVPRSAREATGPVLDIVPGVYPTFDSQVPWTVKLCWADIPKGLAKALSARFTSEAVAVVKRKFLPPVFNAETYERHFKVLLWAEEFRMEEELEVYNITDATLESHSQYHHLSLPGLAEKRPSVLPGDRILVQPHRAPSGKWFEGGVHYTHQSSVGLQFAPEFGSWPPSQLFNVRFKLGRLPLRRQHQALETRFVPDRILFPTAAHVDPEDAPSGGNLRFYNTLVGSNQPQLQAVASILGQAPGSIPFILFGPPGTGKSSTIIEAMRQILLYNPHAHILACAPSNSAADLIASRLTMLAPDELFRYYAPSRHRGDVLEEIGPYTHIEKDSYGLPPMEKLKKFKIIVTTCASSSFAYGIGMPKGHFSHIIIDEAGQATEPEIMIAVKTLADGNTNVVLAGDPKQLTAVIRSKVALELGLEKSILERLMETEVYDEHRGHRSNVVKLVKNFRSHKSILHFPNERFYSGDLEECGARSIINSYLNSDHLPCPSFPIVMHGMHSPDCREGHSPSFFNPLQILQVKSYVAGLRNDRRIPIADEDIGIITPYHAQVQRIRQTLMKSAPGVKVGSVEEFQGQERKIIIISTVRSSAEFADFDRKHTLGFVANPRRFNVAITRAQSLLILIGDPNVLSVDPLWRSFMNYVYLSGGWTGPLQPSWDVYAPVNEQGNYEAEWRARGNAEMDDFTRRMEELAVDG